MKLKSDRSKISHCGWISFFSIILLTVLDQFTKYIAVTKLKEKPSIPVIKGILEFRYLENDGMAFGMFSGKVNIFIFICILFLFAAMYFYRKVPKNRYYLPLIIIEVFLVAGAMGNFIDRLFRGYVVDFIYIKLIDFPIFNVADIYVVGSCIFMMLMILFKYEDDDFRFISFKRKPDKLEP